MPGVQLQRAGHPTWAFSQRSGQRLLHPEHVPVPAELPAHLAENTNLAEPEVAVQRDGGVIGQRGAGVCAMHIHTLESIEYSSIELRSDASTGAVVAAVNTPPDLGGV